jgi:hypothetical protein
MPISKRCSECKKTIRQHKRESKRRVRKGTIKNWASRGLAIAGKERNGKAKKPMILDPIETDEV